MIEAVEGSFQEISGSPFEAGTNPASIAYSPIASGNLFAAVPNYNDGTVTVYKVNQANGVFTQVPNSPFATGSLPAFQGFSPIASGNLFAAVANFNSNSVSVYEVNQTTGEFIPVVGSPFSTGVGPASVEFSPIVSGNLFAAVPNTSDATVSVYSVNQTTGAFTGVGNSPFATGSVPNFATFSPVVSGNLFSAVVNSSDNTVSVYQVNPLTGAFTPVPSSPFPTGANPLSVKFSPLVSGNLFAAVVNDSSANISVYEVNQMTGSFTEVQGSPFAAETQPNGIDFSLLPSGDLLAAVVNYVPNNISVYEVNETTGAFTEIVGSPFPTGSAPDAISFSPLLSGNLFAAVSNFNDNNVSVYQVNTTPLPVVMSIRPNFGPITGGTTILITGANFDGTTAVMFGNVPAASFTINSDTQITAISPPGTGILDVTVTTSGGTSLLSTADLFTYIGNPLPPDNFIGFEKTCKFLNQTEYSNILTWDPPLINNGIVAYNIYRNGHLIGKVLCNQPLKFIDGDVQKGKTYAYYIRSINSVGLISEPAILIIKDN